MKFWIFIVISFAIFFGSLGIIFSLIAFLFFIILKTKKLHFKNTHYKGLSKETKRENLMLDIKEIVDKEDISNFDVTKLKSYKQILYYGTEKEKINLIGMVIYNPSSEFVELIRIALKDENETVRILASTSLQKMEDFYEDKIKGFENSLKNDPTKAHIIRDIVSTYHNYIESTLIDSSLKNIYIEKMLIRLQQVDLNSEESLKLYLKICVKYNKLHVVENVINELIKEKKLSNEYKFLIIEYYFKKLEFNKIYEILQTIDYSSLKDEKEIEAYEYWTRNA